MKDNLLKNISGMISGYFMLPPGGSVLAAVSGGADSVCLLLALKELGYAVCAVHVEHGIRGEESLEDCRFVEQLCSQRGIPLSVEHIDVPALAKESGRGLEETARDARYRIFAKTSVSLGIHAVATAHNLGDQAETVLWNLTRGTGLAGLGGIAPVRNLAAEPGDSAAEGEQSLILIHPLLGAARRDIEAWLEARGQKWCTDRTNEDESITRNAIRKKVMPELEKLNPGAALHIAASAEDVRETEAFLEQAAEEALERALIYGGRAGDNSARECAAQVGSARGGSAFEGDPGSGLREPVLLNLSPLRSLAPILRRRVLLKALAVRLGGARDIARVHVRALDALAFMPNGHEITLPGGLRAVREEGVIRFCPPGQMGDMGKKAAGQVSAETAGQSQVEAAPAPEVPISSDGTYQILGRTFSCRFGKEDDRPDLSAGHTADALAIPEKKYTKRLAYDTMAPCICLRTRRAGDYLIVNAQGGRKKLKDYLIDRKIPKAERDRVILAAQGSHVLWVVGERISEGAKVRPGTHYLEITLQED